MKKRAASGRVFGPPLRGLFVGAAATIAGVSALATVTGDPAVWVAPLGVGTGLWNAVVALVLGAIVAQAFRPLPRVVRLASAAGAALLLAAALRDAWSYFSLVSSGAIETRRELPASLAVVVLLAWGVRLLLRGPRSSPGGGGRVVFFAAVPFGALGVLLALLLTFAATDYRRPAGCAIVLGAGVYPDGRPSLTLSDRVGEGVRLYREGLVPHFLMTGGIDPVNGWSEPRVMRRVAIEAGVPESAIWIDEEGVSTRASARSCAARLEREGIESALLVSHGYHLLRAKTAFRREGVRTYTVPATETRRLRLEPWFVFRECIAWAYYALPWT